MQYTELSEAGQVEFSYSGPPLDVLTIAVLQIEIHQIFEKVAFRSIANSKRTDDLFYNFPFHWPYPHRRPHRGASGNYYLLNEIQRAYDEPLIRVKCIQANVSSWTQTVLPAVAFILDNPDVRAVLQNLGADVVWGILQSGWGRVKSVKGEFQHGQPLQADPLDVGENVVQMVKALAKMGPLASLTITSRNGSLEQSIKVNWADDQ